MEGAFDESLLKVRKAETENFHIDHPIHQLDFTTTHLPWPINPA
jgi:hypothetical protein